MYHTINFVIYKCSECNTPINDPDNNPEGLTRVELREKYDSWRGWLCKCGHYNALDK